MSKLARGRLDVLVQDPGNCHTMATIGTDSEMGAAMFDVNVRVCLRFVPSAGQSSHLQYI